MVRSHSHSLYISVLLKGAWFAVFRPMALGWDKSVAHCQFRIDNCLAGKALEKAPLQDNWQSAMVKGIRIHSAEIHWPAINCRARLPRGKKRESAARNSAFS